MKMHAFWPRSFRKHTGSYPWDGAHNPETTGTLVPAGRPVCEHASEWLIVFWDNAERKLALKQQKKHHKSLDKQTHIHFQHAPVSRQKDVQTQATLSSPVDQSLVNKQGVEILMHAAKRDHNTPALVLKWGSIISWVRLEIMQSWPMLASPVWCNAK